MQVDTSCQENYHGKPSLPGQDKGQKLYGTEGILIWKSRCGNGLEALLDEYIFWRAAAFWLYLNANFLQGSEADELCRRGCEVVAPSPLADSSPAPCSPQICWWSSSLSSPYAAAVQQAGLANVSFSTRATIRAVTKDRCSQLRLLIHEKLSVPAGIVSGTALWFLVACISQDSCAGYCNQAMLFNINPSTIITTFQNCLYLWFIQHSATVSIII